MVEALALMTYEDGGMMPARPLVTTLNTVSYVSQPEIPLSVRVPPLWVKLTAAPVRRLVTEDTRYALSRTVSVLPDGGSTTWM